MNRKQFGKVLLANTKTVDKSHSSVKSAAQGIFLCSLEARDK